MRVRIRVSQKFVVCFVIQVAVSLVCIFEDVPMQYGMYSCTPHFEDNRANHVLALSHYYDMMLIIAFWWVIFKM